MSKAKTRDNQRLIVRRLRKRDLKQVQTLHQECYPGMLPWNKTQFDQLIDSFPEGQLCVELDGHIVAVCSSLLVDGATYEEPHTYAQLGIGGALQSHDPEGDSLYGVDIAVSPRSRGQRLARRLYDARKQLVRDRNLRRILIGGRVPNYHKHAAKLSIHDYVNRVVGRNLRDPTLNAQLANGFSVCQVLPGYLPSDKESCGHAVLLEWLNPHYAPPQRRDPAMVRVATVNYQMRTIASFEEFANQCEFFIDTAGEYHCDFVLFPELLTNQLLALLPPETPAQQARDLDRFTEPYIEWFQQAAIKYNINVIAGTHLTREGDKLYNIAFLFHRDGRIDRQYKLHITPSEHRWWGVDAGDEVRVFDTDMGKIAILICYDVEFPETARIATGLGAQILFVPYNTDIRAAHIRVRTCAAARCIENHVYAVLSGPIGNLPQVQGADIHYAQAAILTPSDIHFPRDGIAAQANENVEALIIHDLDMAVLRRTRRTGSVRPWLDRRKDLYKVVVQREGKPLEV
ncbi:MAG: GNAT family N-acetyltransferase [Myxococcales bacterium]|nr:GNAT family N-acetyltransferase [Myxococcales bacterium]